MAVKLTLINVLVWLACVHYYAWSIGAAPDYGPDLQAIPTDIPLNVTTLDLSWNNFSTIPPRAFSPYDQLTQLSLGHCQISSIADDAFDGCPLERLSLNGNNLMSFTQLQCLESLSPTLQYLTLDWNELKDAMPPFGFQKLTDLSLSRTQMTSFPNLSAISSPQLLTVIDLYFNNIHSVTYKDLVPLKDAWELVLRLGYNHLTSVPDIRGFNITRLELTGNPLVCNTHLAWMTQLQSSSLELRLDWRPCAAPAYLVGVEWDEMAADDLADLILDETNTTCISMKTDRSVFRKEISLRRLRKPKTIVVPVAVLGENLECDEDNNGLQFYINAAETTLGACGQFEMEMKRCLFIHAETTMCHYECDCTAGCQAGLLRKRRIGQSTIDGNICEIYIG